MERMDKPKVDAIHGIPPAIAIEQSNHVKSTRSTVGTITEINDYLKILMPRLAKALLPELRTRNPPRNRQIDRRPGPRLLQAVEEEECQPPAVLVTFGIPVPAKDEAGRFFRFPLLAGLPARLAGRRRPSHRRSRRQSRGCPPSSASSRIACTSRPRIRPGSWRPSRPRCGSGAGKIAFIPAGRRNPPIRDSSLSRPAGIARIATSRSRRRPPACSASTIPSAPAPSAAALDAASASISTAPSQTARSRIAEGRVKPFQTENGARMPAATCSAPAASATSISASPFEELPKADQDFVIFGEKRARNGHRRGIGRRATLVRRQGLLRLARNEDLQDARARAAEPLPHLHSLHRIAAAGASSPRRSISAWPATRCRNSRPCRSSKLADVIATLQRRQSPRTIPIPRCSATKSRPGCATLSKSALAT